MKQKLLIVSSLLALAACSATTQTSAVTAGQLFCAKATADGPLVVALADAVGAPVVVTGLASAVVAADCAAINAIPVSPPAAPASAPTVSATLPAS
jgi:hypothetical protein